MKELLNQCANELEKAQTYIKIIEKENKDIKERMVQECRKAYACGWVDGKNGKPPIDICGTNEVIEIHKHDVEDAIAFVDGAYVSVSQLITAFHDLKEQYNKLRNELEE